MVKFNEWKPGDLPLHVHDLDSWTNAEVILVSMATFVLGVIVGWIL